MDMSPEMNRNPLSILPFQSNLGTLFDNQNEQASEQMGVAKELSTKPQRH